MAHGLVPSARSPSCLSPSVSCWAASAAAGTRHRQAPSCILRLHWHAGLTADGGPDVRLALAYQRSTSSSKPGQLRATSRPAPSAWSVCLGSGQLEVCHEEARWWCWLASGRPKEDCGIAPANRMLDAVGVEIWVASYDRTDERTEVDGWSGRAVDVDGRAQLPGSSVALARVSSEASVTPGPEASRAPGLVQASTASSSRLEGVLRL